MPAPRFLDKLSPDRRAVLEPELVALIRSGASPDALLRWAVGQDPPLQVSRATLANFMREVKGAAAEDPARRIGREVLTGAPPATREPGAAEEHDEGEPIDHRTLLQQQLHAAERIAETTPNARDRIAAMKLVQDLSGELRELEMELGGRQGPRVVFYFPEKVVIELCEAEEVA